MSWTTPADIRHQLQKLWNSGTILASLTREESIFPRRLRLKKPTSAEMAERFAEVRSWIARLDEKRQPYRLVWREIRHRTLGANSIPVEVWVDSLEEGVALIGKEKETAGFKAILERTRECQPQLVAWLARRPLHAVALGDDWDLLLDIVSWLQSHPRPAVYLRQVDIAGVHSKFIEAHRGVLTELLDLVLPRQNIDEGGRGVAGFCKRYGFRDKPTRVRFRLLDPSLPLLPGAPNHDIAVTSETFAELDLPVTNIFITENEINFLALPPVANSMVIFGAGYGFEVLGAANWLYPCRIHYWGDIDTHGFAILDQLRGFFPAAASFLMDKNTLLAHKLHWGRETQPTTANLSRLTRHEQELYDDLRYERLAKNLRLEQERVGFAWVKKHIDHIAKSEEFGVGP